MRFACLCLGFLLFLPAVQAQSANPVSSGTATGASAASSNSTTSAPAPAFPPPGMTTQPPPWTPQPVRDAQAVQIVQAAINALGGAQAIGQVQSCIVQTQVSANAGLPGGQGTWTVSGSEFRSDFPYTQGTATVATGHGHPFSTLNGTTTALPISVAQAWFVPFLASSVLLNEFQTQTYSLQYKGTGTVGTEAVSIVRISSQATWLGSVVAVQNWYFDGSTGLPIQVDYRLPDVRYPTRHTVARVNLSAYQPVSGVLYPFQASKSIGKHTMSYTVSAVQPNANVASSQFDAPAGGAQ